MGTTLMLGYLPSRRLLESCSIAPAGTCQACSSAFGLSDQDVVLVLEEAAGMTAGRAGTAAGAFTKM